MAKQQTKRRKRSRAESDSGNGGDGGVKSDVEELAGYLQERIKPGLNRGAIPLLARSIARELAERERARRPEAEDEADDEISDEADDEISDEADDEISDEADDEISDEADDEVSDEADDEVSDEADDEYADEPDEDEADDDVTGDAEEEDAEERFAPPDFEAEMHDFQEELGEEWILRFSVQGGDAWLTAETDDGSQRVEAPAASVLAEAVALLKEGGAESS